MKIATATLLALCTLCFMHTACQRRSAGTRAQVSAVVTYVYEGRVTRYGYKDAAYRVTFVPGSGKPPVTIDATLSLRTYRKGDSVTVFYDPAQPDKPATDK